MLQMRHCALQVFSYSISEEKTRKEREESQQTYVIRHVLCCTGSNNVKKISGDSWYFVHDLSYKYTCMTSFCTVAWQLARFQLTRRIARSLGDSWASCPLHLLLRRLLGPDLQNILRQSYDNAKITIDLPGTSNLQDILQRTQDFSMVRFTCNIVRSSEIVFVD